MTVFTFDAKVAYSPLLSALAQNVVGSIYLDTDTAYATALTVTPAGGSPSTLLQSLATGLIPDFTLDQATNGLTGTQGARVVWKSGQYVVPITSMPWLVEHVTTFRGIWAGAGDDTTALNNFLAAATPTGVKRIVGSFSVSGPLTVPADTCLDARGATITQTGSLVQTIVLGGDNASIIGGELVGKGTDYVASGSPTAHGITTTGTTGCRVENVTIRNFAGAGVRGITATALAVTGCRIVGVGAPTIAAGIGSPCYGVYLDTSSVDCRVTDCDISACNQGIITGLSVSRLTLANLRVHDIPGQHGIYLQNGTGLNVSGIDLRTINSNGMKLQLSGSSIADSEAVSIRGITAAACLDTALSLNNVATDLTSAFRMRAVTISDVAAVACGRVLYLGSVRGGTVTNVAGYNNTLDGLTFLDCHDVNLENAVLDVVGRIGIRFTLATGSTQDRITCSNVRIRNPANTNTAANLYGVYLLQGSNVTFDGLEISATNGFMQYAFFLASATAADQETFTLRNSNLYGESRWRSTITGVRDWTNNRQTGAFTFKPNAVTAVTAVP